MKTFLKLIILALFLISLVYYLYTNVVQDTFNDEELFNPPEAYFATNIDYYGEDDDAVTIFGQFNENEVKIDHSMFYFVANGAAELNAYQCCIIESSATLNPGLRIFVLFITDQVGDILQDKLMSALLTFPNVFLRFIKPTKYLISSSSIVKNWIIHSSFHTSTYSAVYLNNILSYVFLQKFGGIAMTFDTLLLKPISSLNQFMIKSSVDDIEAHPLSLNINHPLMEYALESIPKFFNGTILHSLGSNLLTALVKEKCQVSFLKDLNFKSCSKAPQILAEETFVPISQSQYLKLYDPQRTKLMLKKIQESNSFGIKLWTHKSGTENIGSSQINTTFYALAQHKCPINVRLLGQNKHF